MKKAAKSVVSGSLRQKKYRSGRSMASIDISRTTAVNLQMLRKTTGFTNDQVVGLAIELFAQKFLEQEKKAKKATDLSPGDKAAGDGDSRNNKNVAPRLARKNKRSLNLVEGQTTLDLLAERKL